MPWEVALAAAECGVQRRRAEVPHVVGDVDRDTGRFFAFTTSKRHIASELLKQTDRSDPLFENNRTRVIAAGRPLLAAAQHAREVRDDLTLEQILDMIVAIATIHGDTGYTKPILVAVLDGLRPPADAKPG